MKIYNLCTKKEYETQGQKKTAWLPVGVLRETEEGKKFIELNILPGQTIYCFEPKPRPESRQEEEF